MGQRRITLTSLLGKPVKKHKRKHPWREKRAAATKASGDAREIDRTYERMTGQRGRSGVREAGFIRRRRLSPTRV
ncbi:MAG: hypothetical protein WBV94_21855 [Blastocatellia bacterium]